MAFASAFSDDPAIRALPTRARFAAHAKEWLDEEFARPKTSLVPALILLAEFHCGIGEKDAGYMYMGMSFRAARAFVLSGDDVDGDLEDPVTSVESIHRNWHVWSAFCHDKIMAIEFELDYDMPLPHSRISLPSIDAMLDSQPWALETPSPSSINGNPPRITTLAFNETCKLMSIAARIIRVLYQQPRSNPEEHTILNIHLLLDIWFNNLPENLLVWARTTSPLPHVIILHIYYWSLLLMLHQPLYQPSRERSKDLQSTEDRVERVPIADLSVKMCDRASHKVVQLLAMFRDQHGLQYFPPNMIWAIRTCVNALLREHASASETANKKRYNAKNGVSACLGTLRFLSETWPAAQAQLERLEKHVEAQFKPTTTITQIDGAIEETPEEVVQRCQTDDSTDVSDMLHDFMREWRRMSSPSRPVHSLEPSTVSLRSETDS
ncbi:Fungal specific transcription factor domain [Ceratobasidium sp. AG-Ba]|nr:Fungal specific transcription factor domain [Ceratobasidium sp. AG-Ba]